MSWLVYWHIRPNYSFLVTPIDAFRIPLSRPYVLCLYYLSWTITLLLLALVSRKIWRIVRRCQERSRDRTEEEDEEEEGEREGSESEGEPQKTSQSSGSNQPGRANRRANPNLRRRLAQS